MKLSEFNFDTTLDQDNTAIFNTYKNSLIILNNTEFDHLLHLEKATDLELKTFQDLSLIVDDGVNERELVENDTMRFANDDRVIIRILTTLDCMADCIYCYENRSKDTMTKETADKVVEFLRELITDKIHIEWFGGEPLYNKEIISYICRKLYEYGIPYTSSMVTNGILANEEVVNELNDWRVNKVQITLDGIASIYSTVKGVPEETFDTVINNIKNIIANKIDVSIRLNYFNEKNFNDLKDLIDYMADNIGYNEYLHYYVYPIFELCNRDREFEPEIVDKVFALQDYIISKGLDKSERLYNIKYKAMGCFATHKNGYTIGPDGTLYGCSHSLSRPIGDIVNGPNEDRLLYLANIPEKCKLCILYPICKGGCKVAELGYDNINQCNLYKNRFEEFVRRMVSNKIDESTLKRKEVIL